MTKYYKITTKNECRRFLTSQKKPTRRWVEMHAGDPQNLQESSWIACREVRSDHRSGEIGRIVLPANASNKQYGRRKRKE
jgi:hypothetical protein